MAFQPFLFSQHCNPTKEHSKNHPKKNKKTLQLETMFKFLTWKGLHSFVDAKIDEPMPLQVTVDPVNEHCVT